MSTGAATRLEPAAGIALATRLSRALEHISWETPMLGLFLQPDAVATISAMDLPTDVKRHCVEVIWKDYTVIKMLSRSRNAPP
jgi:hypothetical protein